MNDFNYKKWNTILGWVSFAVALITYTLTLEPTVSSWDCGEYISTATKLSVGHPPGAPLFQMLGAFFSIFALENSDIALMINFMSGLASAFTILFMFWTITILAKKIAIKNGTFSTGEKIAVLGSGLVGALAYTFSDSFWFSAVEGEVYAMSSFLMALLFWLGLRWIEEINQPRGNKWLVLISFVVGLSFGVHILSLLVIPAIVMLYFFKTYKNINLKTTAIATVISVLVLAFVFKFLFPFTLKFFSISELFFVNSVGLPYNSGTIISGLVLIALFYFGLQYTRKKGQIAANTLILSVLFIMIGFSSWMMLPIRANANTTINENNPSSARELLAYYNREQYGDANVFYDTYYSNSYHREQDKSNPYKDEKPKYEKKDGKYVIVNNYKNALPNWSSKHKGFIPRMVDPSKADAYKAIAGIPKNSTRRPTFFENIKFMVDFQFGYMYGRYFMWNFVGRQNDIQGHLDINNGNWLSGINFIDEYRLGSQQNLPTAVKENKGRNTYFFLPLLLGIIGLLYHLKQDKKNWYILGLFFAFTGFAIIFYTNPKPFEPRERDYAVVGSFYIFAIWIGFGVLALYDALKKYGKKPIIALATSAVSLLAVPMLMGFQNWDDHNRGNRYTAQLNAQAYLESCDPNAILFTIGDNDTFPLWYLQEVEGIRTDIKIVNTSLFQTDWYIDQMKKATYEAPPIPSKLTHDQYKYGTLDAAYYFPDFFPQLKDSVISINQFMKWVGSNNESTFYDLEEDGVPEKILPTNKVRIPVNKENALKHGIVAQKDADKMVDYIDITFDRAIGKNSILMLDILNNFDWKRPIYFTGGSNADSEYIWLKDYLQLDGLSYKLVPIKTPNKIVLPNGQVEQRSMFDMGRIDPEKMYKNIQKWEWKTINEDIHLDEQTKRNAISMRNNMMRLSEEFLKQGDSVRAKEVLDISLRKMPIEKFDHYSISLGYPELYYKIGDKETARETVETLIRLYQEKIKWYSTLSEQDFESNFDDFDTDMYIYRQVLKQLDTFEDDKEYVRKAQEDYFNHVKLFSHLMQIEEPKTAPQQLDTIKP